MTFLSLLLLLLLLLLLEKEDFIDFLSSWSDTARSNCKASSFNASFSFVLVSS
jgi:hypothetical protein